MSHRFDHSMMSAEAMLRGAQSARGARPQSAGDFLNLRGKQELAIKEQVQNQTVKLREAFLREDGRITGTIPKYLLYACLRAGGLELSREQQHEAKYKYMTGEGRFNWIAFCESVESARAKSWNQAARVRSAKAFADIDRDGSGKLSRDELEGALKRWKVPLTKDKLDNMVRQCDTDGDGNISYGEFVDGLVRDLVAPSSIWGSITDRNRPSSARSGRHTAR